MDLSKHGGSAYDFPCRKAGLAARCVRMRMDMRMHMDTHMCMHMHMCVHVHAHVHVHAGTPRCQAGFSAGELVGGATVL